MPKVSVVVPVYNSIGYIRECIESLLNQTLKDIEIIVVDAGSNDGTIGILNEYLQSDKRIKIVQSEKKSMGYQYNLGISIASGEYIGFLESDDYIALTMYEELVEILDHKDIDYVKSDFQMFVELGEKSFLDVNVLSMEMASLYNKEIEPRKYPQILYRDVNMWNGLYRLDFIRNNHIKLNETPKAAFQDTGFVLQSFCLATKIMYVKINSYKYRRDNIGSSTYKPETIQFVIWEFLYLYSMVGNSIKLSDDMKACIFNRFFGLYSGFYKNLPVLENLSDKSIHEIENVRDKFIKLHNEISYPAKMLYGISNSVDMYLLFNNPEIFDKTRRLYSEHKKKMVNDFGAYIERYKRVFIFGAGVRGGACGILLRNNHYSGELFYCDNNRNKWGKSFINIKIISPNESIALYNREGALFIIANANYWCDIYKQLIDCGIRSSDVIPMMPCNITEAFEIHWGDKD